MDLAAAQEKQQAILRALRQQRRAQTKTLPQGRPGSHAKPNLRRKTTVHLVTTAEAAEILTAVWMAYRNSYAEHHRGQDRSTPWALTKSNTACGALAYALDHAEDWILDSQNDGRIEPGALTGVETEKVGLLLPTVLLERLSAVMEDWQDRYVDHRQAAAAKAGLRAGRYRLTREPVLRAALAFSLQTPEAWVLSCPNDDRHAPLAAGDRRTEPASWVRQTSLPAEV
ncbi:hypothetical protein [Modestobacter sp. KNN46-3]|uniref:hypothetical protein n=1 Tax=Modestobacter sp. KNN46-3 TaxID=2711218 RepID=UPI0013DF9A56|nr:hypothetical protein [Modestobacter sp. KNN46-3]